MPFGLHLMDLLAFFLIGFALACLRQRRGGASLRRGRHAVVWLVLVAGLYGAELVAQLLVGAIVTDACPSLWSAAYEPGGQCSKALDLVSWFFVATVGIILFVYGFLIATVSAQRARDAFGNPGFALLTLVPGANLALFLAPSRRTDEC